MPRQFSEELDRQVKAEEIREQLRREKSDIGYEDIQQNMREALDEAKLHEEYLKPVNGDGIGNSQSDTSDRSNSGNSS